MSRAPDWQSIRKKLDDINNSLISIYMAIAAKIVDANSNGIDMKNVGIVKEIIHKRFNVHPSTIDSQMRHQRIAWPRQIAMFLCWQELKMTLEAVGHAFGRRDHGTVHHACSHVRDRMATEQSVKILVDELIEEVRKKINHQEAA